MRCAGSQRDRTGPGHETDAHLPQLAEAAAPSQLPSPTAWAGRLRRRARARRRAALRRRARPGDRLRRPSRPDRDFRDAHLSDAARLGDRRPLPRPGCACRLRRHRSQPACGGDVPSRRRRLPRRDRGALGRDPSRLRGRQARPRLRPSQPAAGHASRPSGPSRDPRPRALSVSRRADGRPDPRLARLPLRLFPMLHALPGRATLPAAAHRRRRPRARRHRQQPRLLRRQLAGAGRPVGEGPFPGHQAAQEEVDLPPDQGQRRDPGPRGRGRLLVRVPGGGRSHGRHPSPHPAAQGARHRRRGHDHPRPRRPGRGLHQAARRLPARGRAGHGGVHDPDAFPAHADPRDARAAGPDPQQRLDALHRRRGRLSAEADDAGPAAAGLRVRLGHLLSGRPARS